MEDGVNEINTTLLGMQQAFANAMRKSGVMGKMRAQLRAAAIGVIRADPCLRHAAVGDVLRPEDLPLEGRVALLLIDDFIRVHGLNLMGGVFEEECNISLMGEAERSIVEKQRVQRQGQADCKSSLLEMLIAGTLDPRDYKIEEQDTPAESSHSTGTVVQPAAPSSAVAGRLAAVPARGGKKPETALTVPLEMQGHGEISAWLKEYEDSLDFSDSTVGDLSCFDERAYDHVEHI
uniref:LisH domain-containing protein n=1 Tax=Trypanosoma congolense (strain IL3000) TaxID=1068625 RepID=G0UM52_TRYCI|nr:conserved hypothetical protein [Trypanosoma congolense IL3000]